MEEEEEEEGALSLAVKGAPVLLLDGGLHRKGRDVGYRDLY